jgi:hypothetical protein
MAPSRPIPSVHPSADARVSGPQHGAGGDRDDREQRQGAQGEKHPEAVVGQEPDGQERSQDSAHRGAREHEGVEQVVPVLRSPLHGQGHGGRHDSSEAETGQATLPMVPTR